MSGEMPFGFDPDDLAAMMDPLDISSVFRAEGLDAEALAEMQRRNLEALEAVNRAASVRYQEDFRTALVRFRAALANLGDNQEALDEAAERMKALGGEADTARDEAMQAVSAEIERALAALRTGSAG